METVNTINQDRLRYLWQQFADKTASDAEIEELLATVGKKDYLAANREELEDMLANTEPVSALNRERWEPVLNRILTKQQEAAIPVHRIHFLKTAWFRYAAILLLIAGTATFLYLNNQPQKEIATTTSKEKPTDIQPGGNKAILTLADGSRIVLDSAANGSLAQQGGTKIQKLDAGKLAYQSNDAKGAIGYNTISTPRGGLYQVVLPDGTNVWLNAASSIRFPTVFVNERKLEVTGEAYFEVTTDKNKPFAVIANGTQVQVLGTSFNINAYADEPVLNATLISGSVQVVKGASRSILKPGQQAQVGAMGIKTVGGQAEKAIAWKNGVFNFEGNSMEEVMRQLARWYAIDVVYPQGVPEREFVGTLSKHVTLESLLKGLKEFGIHYRLEGRTLAILP